MEFNLADLWEKVVDAVPNNEAMVCGERRLTFSEADERINRLAHALADSGVGPGDHVALYLYNGTEYLEGMLAAYKIRAVPINVNYRYVEDELRYLLQNSESVAIIFNTEFTPLLHAIKDDLTQLKTYIAVGSDSSTASNDLNAVEYEIVLASAPAERDFGPRSADDLYILYTGGTTGMPKGVMWRHEDIFFGALGGGGMGNPITTPEEISERAAIGDTRCLPACPFMHGTAHWMAFASLLTGGAVIIDPVRKLDPDHIWQLIADERVNFLVIVGDAMGRPLVEALEQASSPPDLSGLTLLLSGGAILSPSVKKSLAQALPHTMVLDGIGSSEAGGQGQMVVSADGEASTQPRFVMNPETAVLNDSLQPAAVGEVGRLARRGRIPLGYFRDPEKSAATFPEVDGVRWSLPGDHARLEDDGTITVLGRGSVSINTGGEKVYPEEVEGALKSHPDIFDALVVGLPDERWGERVVAVIQGRNGATPPLHDIEPHLRKHIAGYKIPRAAVYVDQIVRSPSGKPDYRWASQTARNELPKSTESSI